MGCFTILMREFLKFWFFSCIPGPRRRVKTQKWPKKAIFQLWDPKKCQNFQDIKNSCIRIFDTHLKCVYGNSWPNSIKIETRSGNALRPAPGIPGAGSGGGSKIPAPGIPGAPRPRRFSTPGIPPPEFRGRESGTGIGGETGGGNRELAFTKVDSRPRFPPPEFRGWIPGAGIGGGNRPQGINP